jgi:hypothetical protein
VKDVHHEWEYRVVAKVVRAFMPAFDPAATKRAG